MLALDLFNTKYERDLLEGAVDKVREGGIPGNIPPEQIPGKEDLLKGKGRSYYEGAEDYAGIYSPEAIALGKRFCEHYNITDDGDVQLAVEIIDSYLDEFKSTDTPVDLKKIRSGVADAFRQVYRGMGPGPMFRKKFQEETQPTIEQSPRALGVANFQRLVKANMGNTPTVSLEFIRPEENFKLDQKGLDLISDYYDGLENDQAKNYFIYRVLPSGDETLKVLKQIGWTPQQVQPSLPGIPTQGELPLQEKKKSDNDLEAGDVKVARELQKLRARYPAVRSDIEAVASAEIDSTERSQQQLAAIRGANEKQDALLKQLVDLDKEQGREIDGLDQDNNSLEQRLAQVQTTNARLQQTIGQMTGTKKATAKTKTPEPQGSTDIARGGIIDVDTPVAPTPNTTSAADTKPTTPSAMGNIVRTVTGLSGPAPSIDKDTEKVNKDQEEPEGKPVTSLKGLRPKNTAANRDEFRLVGEHGGGIGPRQHWQDLMPEQMNPEDYEDEDEDEDDRLRSGDYVRDTQDGEYGEVFRMQGDPYERRVRILDRDGRGWYIEPSRLTRVDPQDPDVQRYFGKKRVRDMDEATGDSKFDAMMGRISKDPWTQLNSDPNWEYEIEELVDRHIEPWLLAMEKSGMPITRDNETLNPGWRKRYEQVATQLAQKYLASKRLNPRDPDLVGKIRYAIDSHTDQSRNVAGQLSAYSELPLARYQNDFDADGMTANMRDAMVGFIPNPDDDDDEPPTRPMPDNDPRRLDPGNMEEAVDKKGATDQVKRVFKDKAGRPVGEIGIDPESSPGNGEWYVHHYATGYSVVGFDSAAEAKRELLYVHKHPDAVEGHPSTTKQGVAEAANVDPQFIDTQVTKILAGEARRMTNASMAQLLAPVMKQYGLTLQQIDGMVPGGLKKAAASYGIMMKEGWSDAMVARRTGGARTPYSVYIKGKKWKDFENDDLARVVMNRLKAKFKADGRDPETVTIAPTEINTNEATALEKFRKASAEREKKHNDAEKEMKARHARGEEDMKGSIDRLEKHVNTKEGKEPTTRQELLDRVDKIQRMMSLERDPANLQILRKELEMLKQRYQHLREDNASEAVERAILNRIMVAHTDLLMKFGPDKVMQAAEEVAYNVGDVDEIGTSDVSAYVAQVKQILGATP
jgi:hypothetical protein